MSVSRIVGYLSAKSSEAKGAVSACLKTKAAKEGFKSLAWITFSSAVEAAIIVAIREASYNGIRKPWDSNDVGALIMLSLTTGMMTEVARRLCVRRCGRNRDNNTQTQDHYRALSGHFSASSALEGEDGWGFLDNKEEEREQSQAAPKLENDLYVEMESVAGSASKEYGAARKKAGRWAEEPTPSTIRSDILPSPGANNAPPFPTLGEEVDSSLRLKV